MRTKYLAAAATLLAGSTAGAVAVQTGTASANGSNCSNGAGGTICFSVFGSGLTVNTWTANYQANTSLKGYIQVAGPGGQAYVINSVQPTQSMSAGDIDILNDPKSPQNVPAGQYCAAFYRLQNNVYGLDSLTCVTVHP